MNTEIAIAATAIVHTMDHLFTTARLLRPVLLSSDIRTTTLLLPITGQVSASRLGF